CNEDRPPDRICKRHLHRWWCATARAVASPPFRVQFGGDKLLGRKPNCLWAEIDHVRRAMGLPKKRLRCTWVKISCNERHADPTERDSRCLPSATTKRIGLRPTASASGGRPSLGHTTKINAVSSAHATTNELMILNVSVG